MKHKLLVPAMVSLMSVFMSSTALAIPLNFEFDGNNLGVSGGAAYDSVSMTVGGVSVDVTAYTIANDDNGVISSMSQVSGPGVGVYVKDNTSNSLGVLSHPTDDGYNMDGGRSSSTTDLDEGLLFSFSEIVSLDYINFDKFGRKDDFNLTVDGVLKALDFGRHDSSTLVSTVVGEHDEFKFNDITGENFLFWADGYTDSFRIDRMTVSTVAVPEPASLLLLGIGLVGLGFSRRKAAA